MCLVYTYTSSTSTAYILVLKNIPSISCDTYHAIYHRVDQPLRGLIVDRAGQHTTQSPKTAAPISINRDQDEEASDILGA